MVRRKRAKRCSPCHFPREDPPGVELRGAHLHYGGHSESGLVVFANTGITKVDELSVGSGWLLDTLDMIGSIEILN